MRKCLFLLLLAILPLQFAWGTAAAYCRHPAGTGKAHFGHHQHQQKSGSAAKSIDLKLNTAGAADDDCVICHFHPVHPAPDVLPEFSGFAVDSPSLDDLSNFRSRVPIGLERPDRMTRFQSASLPLMFIG
ncbi:hypothetical protein ABL840_18855 [Variovorax sp. NFACC27]|jgi:hypothetical protein|uniref:hypothetical protein n=1 Tax=unclassified Variovorax TaxID=663243 RepID=UPI00115FE64C